MSKLLEETVLQAVDSISENTDDQVTKILVDIFKSAILKKYKDTFDIDVTQGTVHKENVDKGIDYCFSEACASFRMLPGLTDDEKESEIRLVESQLDSIKQEVLNILDSRSIEIIP